MAESVWVVETCFYEEREVHGIYTSKENADLIAAHFADAEVTEWPLDAGIEGHAPNRHNYYLSVDTVGQLQVAPHRQYGLPDGFRVAVDKQAVHGSVWATDEAHALQMANDYRRQAQARGEL